MIHRINIFILSLIVALSPTLTFAMFGGWSVGTPNYQGAGSFYYPATKTQMVNGKPSNKTSGFTVPVSASRVAKVLAGGVGAVALAEAVTMLLGAGVDWILDPANNRVVYGDSSGAVDPASRPDIQYTYGCSSNYQQSVCNYKTYATPEAVGQIAAIAFGPNNGGNTVLNGCTASSSGTSYTCVLQHKDGRTSPFVVTKVANPAYDPSAEKEEDQRKSIPLEAVAAQVISNADSHSNADQRRAAVATVQAAAQDIVNEAENDDAKRRPFETQLERDASRDTSETATGSATTRPSENTGEQTTPAAPPMDIALEFPVFCSWAGLVCEAAQEAIVFPTTVAGYVADFWDYVSDSSVPETSTKVDIIEVPQPEINSNYFSWNAYCPFTAERTTIEMAGHKSTFESDLTSWCDMASEIRPFVIMAGALASFLIAAGVVGRSDD